MGEMADYILDNAFSEFICPDCGYEYDWCACGVPLNEAIHDHCEGKEVIRTNSKTGQNFVGCSNFPKCKHSRGIL